MLRYFIPILALAFPAMLHAGEYTATTTIKSGRLVLSGSSSEIAVKSGEKVAFLGDSITQSGWGNPKGYVKLVVAGLKANGAEIQPVPAGISGHKSNDMLARLDRDVLSKKPDWMTLSCGVNDVWHGPKGVPLEAYKKNIREIIDKCAAANVKVIILTATVIKEDLNSPENQKLAAYNDFLRSFAQEKHLRIADLNASFQMRIKSENKPGVKVLTIDGVHMAPLGDELMAEGVLRAFGVGDAGVAKAKEAWAQMK
jgi:lysophospholipase L1-like esterase